MRPIQSSLHCLFFPCTLFLLLLSSRPIYDRHEYLRRYEDEPADEFLEMYRPNSDGTTFIDDAYYMWQALRYQWRRGAGKFVKRPPKSDGIDEETFRELFGKLREFQAIAAPVPLARVIEAEWEDWVQDDEFPTPKAIKAMGIAEFVKTHGQPYEDDTSAEEEAFRQAHPTDHPISVTTAFKDTQ
jgi:hypothetical protein